MASATRNGKRLIAHQGSAIYQLQYPRSFLARFYESIGLTAPRLTYQKWGGTEPELPLSTPPYQAAGLQPGHYGFWFGAKFGQAPGMWLIDPLGKQLTSLAGKADEMFGNIRRTARRYRQRALLGPGAVRRQCRSNN